MNNTDFLRRLEVSPEPLYLQAYKQLLQHIRSGNWQCEDRLPTDMVLAKSLEINHITLRKALAQLTKEGYLTRIRGRGTFVAPSLPVCHDAVRGSRVGLIYDIASEKAFSGELFLNIHSALGELGLRLEFLSSRGSKVQQLKQLRELFSERDSAGCIIWSILDSRQLNLLKSIRPAGYPLVFLDHRPEVEAPGFDFSGYDDWEAGRKLGDSLRRMGFQHCACCFQRQYAQYSTDRNRLAGLTAGLDYEPTLFFDYSDKRHKPFQDFCRGLQAKQESWAVVLISEIDLQYYEAIPENDRSRLRPFVFFTAARPRCAGILLGEKAMGRAAVDIIAERRNGSREPVLSRTCSGELV